MATGFTYLGCPNVEPAPTLPQPTCTHRGVTLLFLEPLKRYSFHCLTVVSARKLFLCCQRDHFHLLSYIVTKMQHLKQRKPLIGCSSHLHYLLLRLPFSFLKWECTVVSPYWVIWHWKPFCKFRRLLQKKKCQTKPAMEGPASKVFCFLFPAVKIPLPLWLLKWTSWKVCWSCFEKIDPFSQTFILLPERTTSVEVPIKNYTELCHSLNWKKTNT